LSEPSLSPAERGLLALFTEIGIMDQLGRAATERALPRGMTAAQLGLLNHFVRLGGEWAPARLARAFQVTKQTMTSTLARLETAGFVEIRADPADGRAKLVSLTPSGRAAHADAIRRLGPALALAADGLPAGLVEGLLPGLEALRRALDAAR
jgi:DNA-binding MarR family transcriptional regulator